MESNGECAGIRITDPPVVAEEDQINKEWCVKGGGIEYIDNEPLPAGTQIPMTTEVVAAVEGRT